MDLVAKYIPPEVLSAVRYAAIAGFICITVLLINLNKLIFDKVLKDYAKTFWWLFVVMSVIPLLVFIKVFSFLFGGKLFKSL